MKHLIIGAGLAGVTAADEIRQRDPSADISLITHEPETPYSRMALPYLIKGQIEEQGAHLRRSDSHFDDRNIRLVNAEVEAVDATNKQLKLGSGAQIGFDKLLIASGGTPLTPPIEGIDLPCVYPCWTLENARQIMHYAVPKAHIVLVGAGFISTTIVEALVERGGSLSIVEMEDRLIPRMMDKKGADIIRKWCEARGVNIITSARVERIEQVENGLQIEFSEHEPVVADLVISATGVTPNIGFLQGSGVDTELGVLVDEFLMTSQPDIYAAGDVAQGLDLLSDQKTVMAIQPVAAEHGRIAAVNMVNGNSLTWRGSINMNVLDMLGLVSCSFGLWEGVEGGESGELYQPEQSRYIQLQFDEDRLIGASSVGFTDHIGVFQGLIQSRVRLGEWKQKLLEDPECIVEAWIGSTQGVGT